jgi:hypothetical protein
MYEVQNRLCFGGRMNEHLNGSDDDNTRRDWSNIVFAIGALLSRLLLLCTVAIFLWLVRKWFWSVAGVSLNRFSFIIYFLVGRRSLRTFFKLLAMQKAEAIMKKFPSGVERYVRATCDGELFVVVDQCWKAIKTLIIFNEHEVERAKSCVWAYHKKQTHESRNCRENLQFIVRRIKLSIHAVNQT